MIITLFGVEIEKLTSEIGILYLATSWKDGCGKKINRAIISVLLLMASGHQALTLHHPVRLFGRLADIKIVL